MSLWSVKLFEYRFLADDFLVAGADEAGMGAWAGPVVAAAVSFDRDGLRRLKRTGVPIRDSKLLSAAQRERAREVILVCAVSWSVIVTSHRVIDTIGIRPANLSGLRRALLRLDPLPDVSIIDAFAPEGLPMLAYAFPKADRLSVIVGAASILAKCHRDDLMRRMHKRFPQYGFDRHKGYGTALHHRALAEHGPCEIHRRSYEPVRIVLDPHVADDGLLRTID